MNIINSLVVVGLLGLVACNTNTQDDAPWWEDEQYNTDDTDADSTDTTDDGKDDDGKDDDGKDDDKGDGGNDDVPDCPEGFDPSESCDGDPTSTACMYGDDLYYCDNGKWVIYSSGK